METMKHVQFKYANINTQCCKLDRIFTKPSRNYFETKRMNSALCKVLPNVHDSRLKAGIDGTSNRKYIEVSNNSNKKCGCLGNLTATPRMNLCDVCGGYSYSGGIGCAQTPRHNITAETVDVAVPTDTSKFTCCPCRLLPTERKQLKLKAAAERLKKNHPLIGGPYADKLASVFSANNKGKQPIIVGYHSDGAPIYVSNTGMSNVIGFNNKGTPIQAGQAGVADKSLVMGYRKDGSPIHPPSNSNPKESMAVIGTYVKDGSPIIGSIKLWGGMVLKGTGKDGNPTYIPLSGPVPGSFPKSGSFTNRSIDYSKPKKPVTEKFQPNVKKVSKISKPSITQPSTTHKSSDISEIKQQKKASLEYLLKYYRNKDPKAIKALMKALENFYPHCKYHKNCLREHKLVPKKKGWKWQNRTDSVIPKLPYLFQSHYKPGAVPKSIAKEIEKDHSSRRYRRKYCISYI